MKPINFDKANTVFAQDQPEYLPLPAHRGGAPEHRVTTCWQFSWWERLKVLFSGRMYFQVLTFGAPLQPQLPAVRSEELL